MSEPLLRDALRLIQDIVVRSKGSPLEGEAERGLEAVLRSVAGGEVSRSVGAAHSQREATIMFADLRGFSTMAAAYPGEVVLGVLNGCLGMMTEIIVRHYGTIDKFMGDAIMAVFHGDPSAPRDHARRALLCAVEMQIAMNEMRLQRPEEHVPQVYLGIGMSTGVVLAGLVGSDAYRAYTVIGEEVNLAARIEAFSLRGQVLMSETTYAHCRDFVHVGDPIDVYVKGKGERVRVREALGIPALGKVVPRQDQRKSPRVNVSLELEYRHLSGKMVEPEAARGRIRDLSYHGALVELGGPVALYSEVSLAFDLPQLGYRAVDVYARVVSIRAQEGRQLAGLEFTSLDAAVSDKIQLYVQMRIQDEAAA